MPAKLTRLYGAWTQQHNGGIRRPSYRVYAKDDADAMARLIKRASKVKARRFWHGIEEIYIDGYGMERWLRDVPNSAWSNRAGGNQAGGDS